MIRLELPGGAGDLLGGRIQWDVVSRVGGQAAPHPGGWRIRSWLAFILGCVSRLAIMPRLSDS